MKYHLREGMVAADSKAKLLRDAERFVIQGRIQQAIVEYLKIVQSDPQDILILNTVGDLFLRLGKTADATRCFSKVAEHFVRGNFLPKAIAVYKKILAVDPGDLQVNLTLAQLYSRQGARVDARDQYLRAATLFEKGGRTAESLQAYEKVVELDPANAAIQRKLAELYQASGDSEKAYFYWTGAARALSNAGDPAGASDAFERAMELHPLSVEAMQGLLDCCLRMERIAPALAQLKKSLALAPDNADMLEMLGHACIADKNFEAATEAFQKVIREDESRYPVFFTLVQSWIDAGAYDRAANCLDSITPILLSRGETGQAVRMYECILQRCSNHLASLTNLASIYSASGDRERHLGILDRISEFYLNRKSPAEALGYLEKYLQMDPYSGKHRELHRQAYAEAYPDVPYVEPEIPPEKNAGRNLEVAMEKGAGEEKETHEALVEADLLLNYGLRDRAVGVLKELALREPQNKDVRTRLAAVYKEDNKCVEAAEQYLLLAVLHRISKNEEAALACLSEARELSPEMAAGGQDLEDLARRNGIVLEAQAAGAADADPTKRDDGVDPSGGLEETFFAEDLEMSPGSQAKPQPPATAVENPSPSAPSEECLPSMEEQFKEIDFYIRLGFRDDALEKLHEIAKLRPDHPGLLERYQRLGESPPGSAPRQTETPAPEEHGSLEGKETVPREREDVPKEPENQEATEQFILKRCEPESELEPFGREPTPDFLDDPYHIRKRPGTFGQGLPEPVEPPVYYPPRESAPIFYPEPPPPEPPSSHSSGRSDFKVNEIFADLIDEVSSLSDQDIAKEDFEEHFSLGIAYREMDLIEEAIREFQAALKTLDPQKDSHKVVQCCGMLSTCFLKKGMPRSAVRWCQTGLSVADISSHESMALRYDMGVAHSMAGSSEQALECFDRIFGMDPGYRDVAQRIDELRANL